MFNEKITKIGNALGLEGKFLINFGFEQIMAIIDPPVEMEEVETKAFRCPSCMRLHETNANDCVCGKYCSQFIKLTGHFRRPKPQPVKRSAGVTFCDNGAHGYLSAIDVAGKTGIFTWAE